MPDKEELERLLETNDRCAMTLEPQDRKDMHTDPNTPEEPVI